MSATNSKQNDYLAPYKSDNETVTDFLMRWQKHLDMQFARMEQTILSIVSGKAVYTVKEFAKITGHHHDTIREKILKEEIKARQDGPRKAIRIPVSELHKFLKTA